MAASIATSRLRVWEEDYVRHNRLATRRWASLTLIVEMTLKNCTMLSALDVSSTESSTISASQQTNVLTSKKLCIPTV